MTWKHCTGNRSVFVKFYWGAPTRPPPRMCCFLLTWGSSGRGEKLPQEPHEREADSPYSPAPARRLTACAPTPALTSSL